MRPTIYISGKITDTSREKEKENVAKGEWFALTLFFQGWAPLLPHLSWYSEELCKKFSHADWLEIDKSWITHADAIFMMPNWKESEGAQAEYDHAIEQGVKIFHSLGGAEEFIKDHWIRKDEGIYLDIEHPFLGATDEELKYPLPKWNNADSVLLSNEFKSSSHPLSKRFYEILDELAALHMRKQQDYGTDTDPFANVRASELWGIPSWVGALVRAGDKIKRLQNFAQKGSLANESAFDSFLDLAVYSVIAYVLYEEESQRELKETN